ncbi:hypothetical protein ACWDKQ_10110 [Saccharopolyspora sp. NPDC000995]
MLGIVPVIGSTEAEARKLESHLHEHIGHSYALHRLVTLLDVELTEKDLDRRLRPEELPR